MTTRPDYVLSEFEIAAIARRIADELRNTPTPAVLSPQDVADLTGFHKRTILREIERGRLHAFEPVKGDYRIDHTEYERWLHANPVKPRKPPTTRDGRPKTPQRASYDSLMSQEKAA